jgi:positive regulator of sigma E activity
MSDQEHEIGFVESVIDEKALISLSQSEACESCNARLICRPDSSGNRHITALNTVNARPGQTVRIEESGNLFLMLSFMQFGLPLIGLLLGIFLANGFELTLLEAPPELVMAIYGFAGLLIGGTVSWLWARKTAESISHVFEIVSICSPDGNDSD